MMDIQGQRVRTRAGRPPCRVRIYPARGPLPASTSAPTMTMKPPGVGEYAMARTGGAARRGGEQISGAGGALDQTTALFISRASEGVSRQGGHHVEGGF